MEYVFGWCLAYLCLVFSIVIGNKSFLPAFLALLYFLFMVVMRGSVGTDTENYESIIDSLSQGLQFSGIEPGFTILGWGLIWLTESPFIVVRIISCLIVLMFFLFLRHSTKDERFILLSYFVPAFIYSYSMNALRIGFASLLILLAFQFFRLSSKSRFVYLLIAATFHYSSLFSIAYIWLSNTRLITLKSFLLVVLSIVLCAVFVFVNISYFGEKLLSYQGFHSPNIFSGLSKVVVCLVFVIGLLFSDLRRVDKNKACFLGLACVISFWMLSTISYAGLRFLDLMSFALPVSIMLMHTKSGILLNWQVKTAFFISGLVATVSAYRNFVLEYGYGGSPFMPYHISNHFNIF